VACGAIEARFGGNISPFALGVGKRGLRRVVEVGFHVIFALLATEILATSLALDCRVFPAPLLRQFLDALSSHIASLASADDERRHMPPPYLPQGCVSSDRKPHSAPARGGQSRVGFLFAAAETGGHLRRGNGWSPLAFV
jgi:hypothetical protein